MPIFPGYDPDFLSPEHTVSLPLLSGPQRADTLPVPDNPAGLLHHANYSVAVCASRKMAWFSGANLDAKRFQPVARRQLTSYWKVEKGLLKETVTARPWYRLSDKKLQRGHLTPADCMEWGRDVPDAILNANDTFFYSNAVPQVPRLNAGEWGLLERYIGLECVKAGNGRLCVHTGPVLQDDDPVYIHEIDGIRLRLPRLFWKMIWYLDPAGRLSRIGFLMSQSNLLRSNGLIRLDERSERAAEEPGPFENLGDYKTYQVGIGVIRDLTGMRFVGAAREPYAGDRPVPLLLQEIEVPESFAPAVEQGVAERDARLPRGKMNLKVLVGLEL